MSKDTLVEFDASHEDGYAYKCTTLLSQLALGEDTERGRYFAVSGGLIMVISKDTHELLLAAKKRNAGKVNFKVMKKKAKKTARSK